MYNYQGAAGLTGFKPAVDVCLKSLSRRHWTEHNTRNALLGITEKNNWGGFCPGDCLFSS